MTRKFEGSGPTEGMPTGSGFQAWLARRAAKGATAPTNDDRFYEAWTSAASGEEAQKNAGVAHFLEPGGPPVPDSISDDQIYTAFTDMLDGRANVRRAQANVTEDYKDRADEQRRHARLMGTPIPEQYRGD